MAVAQCRGPGCPNFGVYSCTNCGRLVCGRHKSTRYAGRMGGPWCQMCGEAKQQSAIRSARTGYKVALTLLLIGATILAINGLTGQGSSAGWYVLGGVGVALGLGAAFQSTQHWVEARDRD